MTTINTVVPGYLAAVSPPWRRSGVFTRSLSSFTGDKRLAADQAGFKAVAIQLTNIPALQLADNLRELSLLRGEFRARGWMVVGWGTYGQNTAAYSDGMVAAQMVKAQALDGWIPNGETWAEAPNEGKSAQFMLGWNEMKGSGPMMLSCLSSVTANYGRTMDYRPFLLVPGCAISPQCYSASDPAYTLPAMRASFAKTIVPSNRVMPTCNVVNGKPIPTRYKRWVGPRWLWTGEDTPVTGFARVLAA